MTDEFQDESKIIPFSERETAGWVEVRTTLMEIAKEAHIKLSSLMQHTNDLMSAYLLCYSLTNYSITRCTRFSIQGLSSQSIDVLDFKHGRRKIFMASRKE